MWNTSLWCSILYAQSCTVTLNCTEVLQCQAANVCIKLHCNTSSWHFNVKHITAVPSYKCVHKCIQKKRPLCHRSPHPPYKHHHQSPFTSYHYHLHPLNYFSDTISDDIFLWLNLINHQAIQFYAIYHLIKLHQSKLTVLIILLLFSSSLFKSTTPACFLAAF